MQNISNFHLNMDNAYAGYLLSREITHVSNESLVNKTIAAYVGHEISEEGILDSLKAKILSSYGKYSNNKYFKELTEDKYFKFWKTNKVGQAVFALKEMDVNYSNKFNEKLNEIFATSGKSNYTFDKNGKLFVFTELVKTHSNLINVLFDALVNLINQVKSNSNNEYVLEDLIKLLNVNTLKNDTNTIVLVEENNKIKFDYFSHSKTSSVDKDTVIKWYKDVQKGIVQLENNIKKFQEKNASIFKLMDDLPTLQKGLLASAISMITGFIRSIIGFLMLHLNETITAVAKAALSLKDSGISNEKFLDEGDTPIIKLWNIFFDILEFIATAFFTFLFYYIFIFFLNILLLGVLTPFSGILVIGLTLKTLIEKYKDEEK